MIRSRYLPVFVLAGMLSLIGAAAALARLGSADPHKIITAVALLLGFGAGATVSPALWVAGFSLPSKMVGMIFALVELVRSVADFILAPVFP